MILRLALRDYFNLSWQRLKGRGNRTWMLIIWAIDLYLCVIRPAYRCYMNGEAIIISPDDVIMMGVLIFLFYMLGVEFASLFGMRLTVFFCPVSKQDREKYVWISATLHIVIPTFINGLLGTVYLFYPGVLWWRLIPMMILTVFIAYFTLGFTMRYRNCNKQGSVTIMQLKGGYGLAASSILFFEYCLTELLKTGSVDEGFVGRMAAILVLVFPVAILYWKDLKEQLLLSANYETENDER